MREIKFQFLYKGLPFSSENPNCRWFKKTYTLDQLLEKPLSQLSDVHSQATLVAKRQFTGLRDKNGVEIYEGDICRVYDHEYEASRIGVVKWLSFYYPAFDIYTVSKVAKSGFEPFNDEFNTFTLDDLSIEVIGNIHENPELLK